MINILIISNNHNDLVSLSDSIRRCDDASMCILTSRDPQEALAVISQQTVIFDIFIVSMQLQSSSGNAFEKKVRRYPIYKNAPFIFLTKNRQDLDACSYLSTYESYKTRSFARLPLDPIEIQSKFCLYIDSIFANKIESKNNSRTLQIRRKGGNAFIPIKDILYLEIQNKVCTIYSTEGKYSIRRISLSKVLDIIDSPGIVRCHRFYAVNILNIESIERINSRNHVAHLKNSNMVCPVSESYLAL